jgi:predicted branched-subunit amino acid permease
MKPFLTGFREAIGAPVLVLAASYVGFGSLVHGAGLPLVQGLFSTVSAWALPGQVAVVELWAAGAGWLAITTAVWLTNLRLMPMVMAIMPSLRRPGAPTWQYLLTAHLVAVTSWVIGMQRCPKLPAEQRLPFFFGVAFALWIASMLGTAVGFVLAGSVPKPVSLALVFLNPVYFLLILMPANLRHRAQILSLVAGAVLGPLFHFVSRDWGLLLTGLAAGTVGWAGGRWLERRDG